MITKGTAYCAGSFFGPGMVEETLDFSRVLAWYTYLRSVFGVIQTLTFTFTTCAVRVGYLARGKSSLTTRYLVYASKV